MPESEEEEPDLRLATRWAVAGGRADICIGGSATGSGFFGCADDRVCTSSMTCNACAAKMEME